MSTTRLNITLPRKTAEDLRRTIPLRSRSKFIARAVEEKLKHQRGLKKDLIASLQANYEYDKRVAQEWSALELEG